MEGDGRGSGLVAVRGPRGRVGFQFDPESGDGGRGWTKKEEAERERDGARESERAREGWVRRY